MTVTDTTSSVLTRDTMAENTIGGHGANALIPPWDGNSEKWTDYKPKLEVKPWKLSENMELTHHIAFRVVWY